MRVGRKGEQDVFPHRGCQVHRFGTGQLDLAGEIRDLQRVAKTLQAGHTFEVEIDADGARGKETALAQADIEGIADVAGRLGACFVEIEDRAFLRAFEVQAF